MRDNDASRKQFTPLQEAAVKRFADQGYAGTSLQQIASDIGIKAPSIYAHFKGKDDLFLSLLEPSGDMEVAFTQSSLAKKGGHGKVLYSYLKEIGPRFESAPQVRFLLQTAYLPPPHIRDAVHAVVDKHMERMVAVFENHFIALPRLELKPQTLALAYQGIVDSLQAEILYCGKENYMKRLKAHWAVFSLALKGLDS